MRARERPPSTAITCPVIQPDLSDSSKAPLPEVGDIVRLQAETHHASIGAEVGVYEARIKAVGLRRILLESPETAVPGEGPLPLTSALPPRTALTLSFVWGDNLYQCETRVVGPAKTGTLAVCRPRIVTKVQRRQFYRLPLQSPTTFRVRGESGSTMPVPARLVNLSGGHFSQAFKISTGTSPHNFVIRARVRHAGWK